MAKSAAAKAKAAKFKADKAKRHARQEAEAKKKGDKEKSERADRDKKRSDLAKQQKGDIAKRRAASDAGEELPEVRGSVDQPIVDEEAELASQEGEDTATARTRLDAAAALAASSRGDEGQSGGAVAPGEGTSPTGGDLFQEQGEDGELTGGPSGTSTVTKTLAAGDPELFAGDTGGGDSQRGPNEETAIPDEPGRDPTSTFGRQMVDIAGNTTLARAYLPLESVDFGRALDELALRVTAFGIPTAMRNQLFASGIINDPNMMGAIENALVNGDMAQIEFQELVSELETRTGKQFVTTTAAAAGALGGISGGRQVTAPSDDVAEARAKAVTDGAVADVPSTEEPETEPPVQPAPTLTPAQKAILQTDTQQGPTTLDETMNIITEALGSGDQATLEAAIAHGRPSLPAGVAWQPGFGFDTSALFLAGDNPEIAAYLKKIEPAYFLYDMIRAESEGLLSAEQAQAGRDFAALMAATAQDDQQLHELTVQENNAQSALDRLTLQLEEGRAAGTLDREQEAELVREQLASQELIAVIGESGAQFRQQQQFKQDKEFARLKNELNLEAILAQQKATQIESPTDPQQTKEQASTFVQEGSALFQQPYSPAKFSQMQTWAAKVSGMQVPDGVVWNEQVGDFVLRQGFGGRKLTPEAIQSLASLRSVYQMRDNMMVVAELENETHLRISEADEKQRNAERLFSEAIASNNISSAEQALAVQRIAEADKLEQERKLLPISMGLQLFSNPVMLGLAQFYGFSGKLEEALGITLPKSNLASAKGDARAFGLQDFLKADEATRGIMQAAFSSQTGGGQQEFFKSIMAGAPGQAQVTEVQRV